MDINSACTVDFFISVDGRGVIGHRDSAWFSTAIIAEKRLRDELPRRHPISRQEGARIRNRGERKPFARWTTEVPRTPGKAGPEWGPKRTSRSRHLPGVGRLLVPTRSGWIHGGHKRRAHLTKIAPPPVRPQAGSYGATGVGWGGLLGSRCRFARKRAPTDRKTTVTRQIPKRL